MIFRAVRDEAFTKGRRALGEIRAISFRQALAHMTSYRNWSLFTYEGISVSQMHGNHYLGDGLDVRRMPVK